VVVGSTPSTDGLTDTSGAGCLIVLDRNGTVRETIAGHGINGPWDMATLSLGSLSELFVTNVLNGTAAADGAVVHRGTVLRLLVLAGPDSPPRVLAVTTIGSGFFEQSSSSAFVVGPTGLGRGNARRRRAPATRRTAIST
jgi:hypothetical protein